MPAARQALILRATLAPLAALNLVVGALAAFAPRTFYDDFPFVASWVDRLPPYNEHLTTDVGAFYLGFGVLFVWATLSLERLLVTAACAAWSLSAALHLVFHLRHLDVFTTTNAVVQALVLAGALGQGVVGLGLSRSRSPSGTTQRS